MKTRLAVASVLCLSILALAGPLGADPIVRIKDLNTTTTGGAVPSGVVPEAPELVDFGGAVYFRIDDGVHGAELWKTDGTAAGTVLVKDICPGSCSSVPVGFFPVGNRLYFLASDGVHGYEIWRTDGTTAGTALVADVSPGLRGTLVFEFASVNGLLLFTLAPDPGPLQLQLWRSDGTAAGTFPLDTDGGASFIGSLGGILFLRMEDMAHGRELWKTDGTMAGTAFVKDIRPGAASSNPGNGAVIGGRLVFAADDGTAGRELWATDGSETFLLKDIQTGAASSSPEGWAVAGGRLFFAADDGTTGAELWATDGTATALVKDIQPGSTGAQISELTAAGARVFFRADDGVHGNEMWVSDGSEAGTHFVKDIRPGTASPFLLSHWAQPTAVGDKVVFFADDGSHGIELWVTDGTPAGTLILADLNPGPDNSFYPEDDVRGAIASVGGQAYFRPFLIADGPELWRTDGTPAGTVPVAEIDLQTSAFQAAPRLRLPMAGLNGKLLFQATDGITGAEPWATDGTSTGTIQLADSRPGPSGSTAGELAIVGETAFFTTHDGAGDWEMWTTDAAPSGTVRMDALLGADPSSLTPLGNQLFFLDETLYAALLETDGISFSPVFFPLPANLTRAGDYLFFTLTDPNLGVPELWKSDGVDFITVKQFDNTMSFHRFTPAGGLLFFHADASASGRELWRSDGTEAGTFLVKDIRPGPASSLTSNYDAAFAAAYVSRTNDAAVGNLLFFSADDGASGFELWRSDGTAAGTWRVKDVFPGPGSSEVTDLTAVGSRVFFVADDGVHGRELWVSDGTEAGTRLAVDLVPGPGSSLPQELAALGHVLLFSATDGVQGREPWRSNGTAAGTRRIADVAPGALSSSPFSFTAVGPDVYFPANDNATGFELWAAPRSSVLATFQDVPTTHWAWSFVESLAAAGITTGCAAGQYCPDLNVSRAEMAVFLERGLQGAAFVPPPATGTVFTDVPASYWAAAWIEQLAADGITTGCAPSRYCPESPVNRAEMAVFLLRSKHGAAYTPPPATGTVFTDVPASYWAAAWIEQLAAEEITTGCAPNQYCPDSSVSRDQMAAFLVRTFALPLP